MRVPLPAAAAVALLTLPVAAVGDPKPASMTQDEAQAAASTLVLAFDHDESSYLRGVFAAKVALVNLSFDDLACNKAFGRGKRRTVTKKQHAKLATCLLGARWRPTASRAPTVESVAHTWRLVIHQDNISDPLTELTLRPAKDGTLRLERIEQLVVIATDVSAEEGVPDGVEGGEIGGYVPAPPPPPPPPPPPVAPSVIEGLRLTGDKLIEPDDATKKAIHDSGKAKVVGAYKMCVDETGAVSSVRQLKSTGFPAYDLRIATTMKTWTYRPLIVNGNPAAACTAMTFVYAQQ